MTDHQPTISERLRNWCWESSLKALLTEAADEIDRLRADAAAAHEEGFRQAVEECAKAHELTAERPGFDAEWHRHAAALMRSVGDADAKS